MWHPQMLLPIFASLAMSSGNNPMFFMIPATLASSLAFMLNMLGILVVTIITWLLGVVCSRWKQVYCPHG